MSSFSPKLLSVTKGLVAVTLIVSAQMSSAETLLDVYRDAIKHDPSFAKTLAEWDIAVADQKLLRAIFAPMLMLQRE